MSSRSTIFISLLLLFLAYLAFESRALFLGPELLLPYPDTVKAQEETFLLKGKTDPLSKVFINSEETPIDPEGNFSFPVSLRPGANEVEIKTRNRFNRESIKRMTVLFKS